jgi:hypothetical protein
MCKGFYNLSLKLEPADLIWKISKTYIFSLALITLLVILADDPNVDFFIHFAYFEANYILYIIGAALAYKINKKIFFYTPRALLVGRLENLKNLSKFIKKSNLHLNVIGCVSVSRNDERQQLYLGNLENLPEIIHKHAIDEVFFMN